MIGVIMHRLVGMGLKVPTCCYLQHESLKLGVVPNVKPKCESVCFLMECVILTERAKSFCAMSALVTTCIKPTVHQSLFGSVGTDNAIDLALGTFQIIIFKKCVHNP